MNISKSPTIWLCTTTKNTMEVAIQAACPEMTFLSPRELWLSLTCTMPFVQADHYKEGFSQEKSMAIIEESRGSHFDPDIAEIFLSHIDEIEAVFEVR